jgi:hypothetical protein
MKVVQPLGFERRAFGRKETHISAQVRAGHKIHACTIKDLSEGGALLEFSEEVALPVRLWLSWSDTRSEVMCEVRHARKTRVGVQFTRPMPLAVRPAIDPVETATVIPALPPRTPPPQTARGSSASDLVAQRRHAFKAASETTPDWSVSARDAAPSVDRPDARIAEITVGFAGEMPRDVSALFAAVHAEIERLAVAAYERKLSKSVPRPLPASAYTALAPVAEPANAVAVPRPLPASAYGGAVDWAGTKQLAARTSPLPLRASAYAQSGPDTPIDFLLPIPTFEAFGRLFAALAEPGATEFESDLLALADALSAPMPPSPLPARGYRDSFSGIVPQPMPARLYG